MKKYLVLLFLMPCLVFSQSKWYDDAGYDSNAKEVQKKTFKILPAKTFRDSITGRIDYMQYCIDKFHAQHKTATLFEYTGYTAVITGGLILPNNVDFGYTVMGIGGTFTLIGVIIDIDSYKWLKRASINPYPKGASITINF